MQGLGHCLVVAPRNLQHEVLIEILSDLIYGIDSCLELILFLPCDVKYPVAVPTPFTLDNVPYSFDRVQLTTLRRKKLTHEPFVIELVLHDLAVVDREVVHHHDTLLKGVDPLERFNEGQEGIHGIAAQENLCKHKSMLYTQRPNHGDTLPSLVWQLYLHAFFDPHPRRLHPEVEGGLIDVDDVC